MKPEVHLLGISIKTFGVTFALGFVACGMVVARRLRELGRPVDWAYEMGFSALLGGIVGSRVYFVIQNWSSVKSDLIGNIMRAQMFSYQRGVDKLGKPVDHEEWGMTPQTVNAYYDPTKNEIVFPAAILQPPFFNAKADDAVLKTLEHQTLADNLAELRILDSVQ